MTQTAIGPFAFQRTYQPPLEQTAIGPFAFERTHQPRLDQTAIGPFDLQRTYQLPRPTRHGGGLRLRILDVSTNE